MGFAKAAMVRPRTHEVKRQEPHPDEALDLRGATRETGVEAGRPKDELEATDRGAAPPRRLTT